MEHEQHIKNTRFFTLLEKFRNGKCSLAELYELETFFGKEETASALKDRMMQELDSLTYPVTKQFSRDKIFQRLKQQIRQQERKNNTRVLPLLRFVRIAALVVLSFLLGGTSVYFAGQHLSKDPVEAWCEIVAPLGSKTQVTLPDSSQVWLNAGSKLRYATTFSQTNRILRLEGEGYFEVAKNKRLPFIVDAWGFLVQAVGTEFNMKAYEEEPTVETILVTGKLKLDNREKDIAANTYLDPYFKATYYKTGFPEANTHKRLVITRNVDPLPLISWKDGTYIFQKELLKDLAVKLGRRYNYSFHFESNEIKRYRFSGTLKDETLQQVMEVIRFSSPISYKIQGQTVTIKKDHSRTGNFSE